MSKRVSHSLLDPLLGPPIKRLYKHLPIPRWFPPEGIIAIGHLSAIAGAFGLAFATKTWWGGLLAVAGIAGNHVADCVDGTHARTTGQCRNGGELLDHFTDPVSFSYWITGLAVSIGRLDLGLAGVIVLYATAVLTSIKAKMIGEFTLARFGPTEFKTLLVIYGIVAALCSGNMLGSKTAAQSIAYWFYLALLVVGVIQLLVNLVMAVIEVNTHGAPADTSEWEVTGGTERDKPNDRA
jgi:archaetidylinositol phosphate synthase